MEKPNEIEVKNNDSFDETEITPLNLDLLDVEELEHRLELANMLAPGCGVNWLWD